MNRSFWVFEYPKRIVYEPPKTSSLVKVYEGDSTLFCSQVRPHNPWDALAEVLHQQTVITRIALRDVTGEPVAIERFALIQRGGTDGP